MHSNIGLELNPTLWVPCFIVLYIFKYVFSITPRILSFHEKSPKLLDYDCLTLYLYTDLNNILPLWYLDTDWEKMVSYLPGLVIKHFRGFSIKPVKKYRRCLCSFRGGSSYSIHLFQKLLQVVFPSHRINHPPPQMTATYSIQGRGTIQQMSI